ncbi:hypothetical protein CQW23_32171 [Capsicum baccatum]|uniref:Protein kinase domain-containing protein n=1 Tax=Capsicum baccatum TaxID=33114 RepID=A0A2G2V5I0_CAPBA|nr:hypothetical protein CQW23_32171 [Capsicum baccatum]
MLLQTTYQDKATQTDIIEDDALEKIFKNLTTLLMKVNSMGNEIEKLKTNEDKLKSIATNQLTQQCAELCRSEDIKIPELEGDVGALPKTHNVYQSTFAGSTGDAICKLQRLDVLDLTQNQFSGFLTNCLGNVTSLGEIYLGSNILSSNIPPSLGNLKDLVVLDLSSNNMVGSLSPEIGNLKAATLIDMSMNQFSNEIPREIGGLQNLVNLSLRHNKLQGAIPDTVSNMVGGPFKNLSSQFFTDNEALCGSSRFSVPSCPTSSKHKSNRKKLLVPYPFLALAILFVPIIFVFVWIRYKRGKRAPQQDDSLSTKKRERIPYYELLQPRDDLSDGNLIGSGRFCSVYKGILNNGIFIVVKVFNLQQDEAFKSFDTECEVLHSLRHRNRVKVITSCSNLDFKALVLEYMPNGSLEKYLYLHNYFLNTRQSLSIMIDVACALEYLRHGCSSPVIHCDRSET